MSAGSGECKNAKNVFCPSKEERERVDRSKCTPLLSLRAMLCIKQILKMHCISRTLCGVGLPQTPSQSCFCYVSQTCYVFNMFVFSKHACICVLSTRLFVGIGVTFCIFFTAFFKTLICNFNYFSFIGYSKQQKGGCDPRSDDNCFRAKRKGFIVFWPSVDLKWKLLKEWNFSETNHQSSPCK